MDYQMYKALIEEMKTMNNFLKAIETILGDILLTLNPPEEEEE